MTFPYKIRTSKWKTLGLLLVGLVFVIGGIWMGGFWGWSTVIFFGICVMVFAVQTWPNSSYLLLTERGFIIRSMFREHMCEWKDCGPFSIQNLGGSRFVVFKFHPDYKGHPFRKKLSSLTGMGALPGSYTLSLDELASKMNAARKAALKIVTPTANELLEETNIVPKAKKVSTKPDKSLTKP